VAAMVHAALVATAGRLRRERHVLAQRWPSPSTIG
jgi:hypothetical protein